MDTGGQDQVIFDMDQGYNQSYTQDQVDEMNQQLNQTRSVFLSTLQGKWVLVNCGEGDDKSDILTFLIISPKNSSPGPLP